MTPDLIKRHALPLPRYTSYPTANHFSGKVTADEYKSWLADLPPGANLSLYLHIPFCKELCWYCGCATKAVKRYDPVVDYMVPMIAEIKALGARVPRDHKVSHIHFGGGSPDILKPDDIVRVAAALRGSFHIEPDAEFAVEIDPRLLSAHQADAFAAIGINRVSIGVQDFAEDVQRAIGRMQSYETTRHAVDLFRDRGVGSINVDLVYGLPHQTEAGVVRTIDQVLALKPDRIAIFGYAHLPERLRHQRLIDEAALPGPVERFQQSRRLAQELARAGYKQLGLDHFARVSDTLATKSISRNFQGYTTDQSDALLGIGASAISRLPQGYAQNAVPVDDYTRRIEADGVATVRGHFMSPDDHLRAFVIDRLMCDFAISWPDLTDAFGNAANAIRTEAAGILDRDGDHLVEQSGDEFRMTERGRPLVRNICAAFDAYLTGDAAQRRHALSV